MLQEIQLEQTQKADTYLISSPFQYLKSLISVMYYFPALWYYRKIKQDYTTNLKSSQITFQAKI